MNQPAAVEKSYWLELANDQMVDRVIFEGVHYTIDELGTGPGFGGQAFRIDWMDEQRAAVTCNLFLQGEIPDWIRNRLADNARAVTPVDGPELCS